MHHLTHKIFIGTEDGKRLLEMYRHVEFDTEVFPISPAIIEQHGGPLAWAAFRAGKQALLNSIALMAKMHEDQITAENSK